MLDLAIVIVTWNVRDIVLDALQSLYADLASSNLRTEVYVVDSASSDGTPDAVARAFPQTKLKASTKNLGFAGGNNYALQQMGFGQKTNRDELPEVVYLLNPDTITQSGATRTLYDTLMNGHPKLGLVGARLSYSDGSFQHSAFQFPGLQQLWAEFFPTPGRFIEGTFNGRYPRHLYNDKHPFSIDTPLGATWMLKREVIEETGMFDPNFFMYCEEIDWAWRIKKAGWDVQCVPAAHVIHLAGQSTSQIRPQSVINLWTSRLLLFKKHYPAWKFKIARRMIAEGMRRKAKQETNTEVITAYHQIEAMVWQN